jgi:hypothetical protein
MRVLIVGADGRGSFQMRGQQLGAAIGARVTTRPSQSDWAWAEVIVLVKHAATVWGPQAKRAKVPVLWDVLDIWRQPQENQLALDDLRRRVVEIQETVGIVTLIAATHAMATAIGGVCLPHHSRLGLRPAPVREHAVLVAYEGQPKYLGSWRRILEAACASQGMTFVVNPPDLRLVDIVVAFRGECWDGDVCRQWKSGVKVVNAVAAGRPLISQDCAGARENASAIVSFVETPKELPEALSECASFKRRQMAHEHAVGAAEDFTLDAIAGVYRRMLETAVAA